MALIHLGTCGYYYKDWIEAGIYPDGTKKDDFLRLYSSMFSTVELDFTYYAMPTFSQIERMREIAPNLTFSIKANKQLTHEVDPAKWRDVVRLFRESIAPLVESHNLIAVLLQFPQSFDYTTDTRRYFTDLIAEFTGVPIAVEFRNARWYNQKTLDALKSRQIPLVCLDMPEIKNKPPVVDQVGSRVMYFRLHGRNAANWWTGDNATRYDYDYTDLELEEIVRRVTNAYHYAESVAVYFNNHSRGMAVRNANALKTLLKQAYLHIVEPKEVI